MNPPHQQASLDDVLASQRAHGCSRRSRRRRSNPDARRRASRAQSALQRRIFA
jgi:hypothetical protein